MAQNMTTVRWNMTSAWIMNQATGTNSGTYVWVGTYIIAIGVPASMIYYPLYFESGLALGWLSPTVSVLLRYWILIYSFLMVRSKSRLKYWLKSILWLRIGRCSKIEFKENNEVSETLWDLA